MHRAHLLIFTLLLDVSSRAQTPPPVDAPAPKPVWFSDRNNLTIDVGYGGFAYGAGIGFDYERILGRRGRVSVHLPVSWSRSEIPFNQRRYIFGLFHRYNAVIFAPGFRYHPLGAFRKADFTLGGKLAFGPLRTYQRYSSYQVYEESNRSSFFFAPQAEITAAFRGGRKSSLFGAYFAAGPCVAGDFGRNKDYSARHPLLLELGLRMGGSF